MNIGDLYLFELELSFFLDICLRVGLLDHISNSIFSFFFFFLRRLHSVLHNGCTNSHSQRRQILLDTSLQIGSPGLNQQILCLAKDALCSSGSYLCLCNLYTVFLWLLDNSALRWYKLPSLVFSWQYMVHPCVQSYLLEDVPHSCLIL